MRGSRLLEREDQLAEAARLVESLSAGEGGLLLIEGVSGIGKTRLLRATRELAAEVGATTLSARGSELERQSPFGVVRSLIDPPLARADLAEREALLAGVAGGSRRLFDAGEPTPAGTEAFDLLHSLAWLAINLAERAPLVLLVDDAHWLDSPSARFLSYLADRLEDAPILVVVALRPDEPGAPPTLFLGRVRAAYELPPSATNSATTEITFANVAPDLNLEIIKCLLSTGGDRRFARRPSPVGRLPTFLWRTTRCSPPHRCCRPPGPAPR